MISGAPEAYGGLSLPQLFKGSQSESQLQWLDIEGKVLNSVVLDFNLPRGVRWSSERRQYVARQPADTTRGGGSGPTSAQTSW